MTTHAHIINIFNSVHEYSAWDAANALQLSCITNHFLQRHQ